MNDPATRIFLCGLLFATLGITGRLLAELPAKRRNFRRLYVDDRFPLLLRNTIAVAPLTALGMLSLGSLVLLPRWLAAWLALPALSVIALAVVLSYRVPAPFLPRWLRDEIEQGITPVARPDLGDRVILALILTIFVLGNISGLIYLVVFHGGPAGT